MALDTSDPSFRDAAFRKGEFRETAREIVSKDRDFRKFGRSVDTGGAIVRAMEAAYKLGLAHGASQAEPAHASSRGASSRNTSVAWNTIPPRSRAIFERICSFKWIVLLAPNALPWQKQSDQWACYWDWGDQKPDGERFELADTCSRSTLAPIVRLGLMEEKVVAGRTLLALTPLAFATWADAVAAGHVREAE